jgi:hypothetical protein
MGINGSQWSEAIKLRILKCSIAKAVGLVMRFPDLAGNATIRYLWQKIAVFRLQWFLCSRIVLNSRRIVDGNELLFDCFANAGLDQGPRDIDNIRPVSALLGEGGQVFLRLDRQRDLDSLGRGLADSHGGLRAGDHPPGIQNGLESGSKSTHF